MKNYLQKQPLYITLGIIIISTVAAIMSIHSTYVYLSTKNKIIEEMKQSSKHTLFLLKDNVTNLMAAYAVNEYDVLIQNEMRYQPLFSIVVDDYNTGKVLGIQSYISGKIRDADGNIIDFDPESSEQAKQLEGCCYSYTDDIVTSLGDKLGSITIHISNNYLNQELKKIIMGTIINLIAISLLLIFSLLITIRFFILKPISNIVTAIGNSDEDGIPLGLIPSHGATEIFTLSNTMNSMISSIKDSRIELKKQHDELSISYKQLNLQATALQAAADGIVITNKEGSIQWVNPAYEKITGYSFKETLGKNPRIFKSGHQDQAFYDNLWKTILSGKTWNAALYNKRKDGSLYLEDESITPVFGEGGEISHFVAIKRDITAQRNQEEQLHRSQKMDALGKLTGGIAHDYNNMLSVILGYADMLQNSLSDNPKLATFAGEIHRAGERGAKLTRKLLSFSRQQISEAEVTDINEQLGDIRLMLEKTLTVRIKLVLELADGLWPVWLDGNDLDDAILNMSINAMHAMPDGGQLVLATSNHHLNADDAKSLGLEPGDYVMLALSDTGTGMDEETRTKIFDPFFSTKGEMGTGLGLSQVYGFVQHAKGEVNVVSEPGYGTRFTLYFPRYHIEGSTSTEKQELTDTGWKWRGHETILVVDDEPGLLNVTQTILTSQGYQVLCAESAEQALTMLETEQIDLLLSDVIMPNMDGYQLARKVRKCYPKVKIQLMSGFDNICSPEAMDDERLLQKPLESHALLQRVRTMLDNVENPQVNPQVQSAEKLCKPIEWSDDYSTQITEIDTDHKELLAIVTRYQQALSSIASEKTIKDILDELLDYTEYHFKREEIVMEACTYPGLENHSRIHKLLLKRINIHVDEFERGELTAQKLNEFMVDWFTDHIMHMDKHIAPYAKGKEGEISRLLKGCEQKALMEN